MIIINILVILLISIFILQVICIIYLFFVYLNQKFILFKDNFKCLNCKSIIYYLSDNTCKNCNCFYYFKLKSFGKIEQVLYLIEDGLVICNKSFILISFNNYVTEMELKFFSVDYILKNLEVLDGSYAIFNDLKSNKQYMITISIDLYFDKIFDNKNKKFLLTKSEAEEIYKKYKKMICIN